jgi:hypothetical protein
MGYYINNTKNGPLQPIYKANQLLEQGLATRIDKPTTLPENKDKAIVCVVSNGPFDAAAYCYSQNELEAFSKFDGRNRVWLEMDRQLVEELTNFK